MELCKSYILCEFYRCFTQNLTLSPQDLFWSGNKTIKCKHDKLVKHVLFLLRMNCVKVKL